MLVPLVAGAIAGRLRGGRLVRLAELRLRAPALIFVVLASQSLLGYAPSRLRGAVVVLSYAIVGAWIVLNLRGRSLGLGIAFALVGLGWAMNFAAMAPNGAMPVSEKALSAAGAPAGMNIQDGHLYKHVRRPSRGAAASPTSTWLGDEIPVPALRAVISLGDIALAFGILLLVAGAMVCPGGSPSMSPRRRLRLQADQLLPVA